MKNDFGVTENCNKAIKYHQQSQRDTARKDSELILVRVSPEVDGETRRALQEVDTSGAEKKERKSAEEKMGNGGIMALDRWCGRREH